MKKNNILQRYSDGIRDFQEENLSGLVFEGADLSDSDFSKSDIRSAKFIKTNLRGANFSNSRAGLNKSWFLIYFLVLCFLSVVFGFAASVSGQWTTFLLLSKHLEKSPYPGFIFLFFTICILVLSIRKNLQTRTIIKILIGIALVFIASVFEDFIELTPQDGKFLTTVVQEGLTSIATVLAISILIEMGIALVIIIANAIYNKNTTFLFGVLSLISGIIGTIVWAKTRSWISLESVFPLTMSLLICILVIGLSLYSSWRAITGDNRDSWYLETGIFLASIFGTSFNRSNLTEADFSNARLRNTDFRNATLTRTCWQNAQKLELVVPGNTYLNDHQIQQWLVGKGKENNFDGKNLRGVNLNGATLKSASFIRADLSEASLRNVDLTGATLVQTQLDSTDFTGAILTGSYIEDWGITVDTKLSEVICNFIFMRLPTEDDPNPRRKPDNWNESFRDGDFAEFIQPMVDTLDLYHNQGVDPRAIAISFKELAESNPEAELEITAMEKRGKGNFLLRAKTAKTANHSQLNKDYFEAYNRLKALPRQEIQLYLAEKDSRISSLENFVELALKSPKYYAEKFHHEGDIVIEDNSININESSNIGNITGVVHGDSTGVYNLGDIQGDVIHTIQEIEDSSVKDGPDLKSLLTQLQEAIVNESTLNSEDKLEALEQVKALAKASQNTDNGTVKKLAKRAMTMLRGILSGLSDGVKLVQECKTLLPVIASLLGIS